MDKTALRTAAAKYGTPLYLFDLEAFTARAQRVRAAFGSDVNLCYSMKANPFVLRGLPDVFRWVEVCSPGELTICERLGIPPERILYSGVNKGAEMLRAPSRWAQTCSRPRARCTLTLSARPRPRRESTCACCRA